MNLASLLILALVLAAAVAALLGLRRRRKRGASACAGCSFREECAGLSNSVPAKREPS